MNTDSGLSKTLFTEGKKPSSTNQPITEDAFLSFIALHFSHLPNPNGIVPNLNPTQMVTYLFYQFKTEGTSPIGVVRFPIRTPHSTLRKQRIATQSLWFASASFNSEIAARRNARFIVYRGSSDGIRKVSLHSTSRKRYMLSPSVGEGT